MQSSRTKAVFAVLLSVPMVVLGQSGASPSTNGPQLIERTPDGHITFTNDREAPTWRVEVDLDDLDATSLALDSITGQVVIACHGTSGHCVMTEDLEQARISRSTRLILPLAQPPNASLVAGVLADLLRERRLVAQPATTALRTP